MPLILHFHPYMDIIVKLDSSEVKALERMISEILHLTGNLITTTLTSPCNRVIYIEYKFTDVGIIDKESENTLAALIQEKLAIAKSLFFLYYFSYTPMQQPYKYIFNYKNFRPPLSRNAKAIAHIDDLDVPDEFCCSISREIMDHAVYDIRNKEGVRYDEAVLKYWLNSKDEPKRFPHTTQIFNECFLAFDSTLQQKIIEFVSAALQNYNRKRCSEICEKYCSDSINDALRKVAISGNQEEIDVLLHNGALIDDQDNGPQKYTPLHHALLYNNIANATHLLWRGSRIDIVDAEGNTALKLIHNNCDSVNRYDLVSTCVELGLISNLTERNPQSLLTHHHLFLDQETENQQPPSSAEIDDLENTEREAATNQR